MILPHTVYENPMPVEQVLEQVLQHKHQEMILAVSKLFFQVKFREMSHQEELDCHQAYRDYYDSWVDRLKHLLGEPIFSGHHSDLEWKLWKDRFAFPFSRCALWQINSTRVYIRRYQEDRELSIHIVMGCEGSELADIYTPYREQFISDSAD